MKYKYERIKCVAHENKHQVQYRDPPEFCIYQDCVMWTGSGCAITVYNLYEERSENQRDFSVYKEKTT